MYAWYCILLKNFHRKSLYFEISSLELTHLSCIITILYHAYSLSHIWLFVTLGTIARQAPLSMGFSGQEYRSGCHTLLQGIFPTQGLNSGLPHCRWILYLLSHQRSPTTILGHQLVMTFSCDHTCNENYYY